MLALLCVVEDGCIVNMPHNINLITTIAAALGLAMVMGFVVSRLKMPPVVGYLIAGIVIGPATPGFVADVGLARQLAEIGVMLLMFGVGLHFSLDDLLAVRRVVVPGAIVQMCISAGLGIARGAFLGMDSWSCSGLRPRAFGRQHGSGSEGAGRRPRIAVHQRSHSHRLAHRRGPGDGAGARACCRHWDKCLAVTNILPRRSLRRAICGSRFRSR